MELTDFIAVLCSNSLAVARVNKLKPGSAPTFYAELAYPPEAGVALQALAAAVAPGGSLAGLEISIKVNNQKPKPIPGVPGDWLVVKASTQFAPYLADAAGAQMVQGDPAMTARINAIFFAGARVRASLAAFAWTHPQTGRRGISFNLNGIMDTAQGGDRLNIGSGTTANAFARFVQAAAPAVGNPFSTAPVPPASASAQPATSPAVAPATAVANPFAQQATAAANPFSR